VEDTGAGFPPDGKDGVGLANVRRRLELCYGEGSRLRVESSGKGAMVEFLVPAELQQQESAVA
jgi:sensor histidine kinase YesM